MKTFEIRTARRNEFMEITAQVRDEIARSEVRDGLCVVYCPHTTAGLTINENADPDVVHDMLLYLDRTIPKVQSGFRHGEGNSDSHIKASFFGSSVTVIVAEGKPVLGTWQGIWFCEFDGPRTRQFMVRVTR